MWLVYVFIGIGIIFQTLGALALHRFPDVYTRLHGTTMCTTLGSIFLYIGVILYVLPILGRTGILFSIHVVMLFLLVMITSSTGAHAIARASHRSGILPKHAVIDRLEEKSNGL